MRTGTVPLAVNRARACTRRCRDSGVHAVPRSSSPRHDGIYNLCLDKFRGSGEGAVWCRRCRYVGPRLLDPGKTEKEKLVSEAHTFEAMPGFVYIVESKSGKLLGILAKQKGTENFLRDIKARDVLSRQNLRPLRG
jgi:hypothetical protein